jgi:carboxypeptidase family protein/PDZ domain-containing protein
MTRKVLVVVVVVVLALVAAWRFWPRHDRAQANATTAASATAHHVVPRGAQATPATVSGRVERASDHAGIAGAFVSITHADFIEELAIETPTIVVTTDANGGWTAPKVPPGQYVVAATSPGFLPAKLPKVWVDAGEQKAGIVLALDAGGTLVRGTVSDVGGGGIPGARVTVHPAEAFDWQPADYVAITGADGTYQLTLRDGNYDATARHDDYTRVAHDLEVAGKPVTLDFVLTPGGVIHGVVIAHDTGKPVPHAMVAVKGRGRWSDGGMPDTTTDDDGAFTVKSVKPGLMSISAAARGYASTAPTTVEVGIGETVDNVRVLVDRAYSISGRVVEAGTKTGMASVHVGAFSMGQGAQALDPNPTDTDGKFEIIGVRPGHYMLFAFGENNVPDLGKPVDIVDKDVTGIELELQGGVTVTGRVDPPQIASLSLELAGEVGIANMFEAVKTMMVRADSDASGAFKLQHVPVGAFKVVARTTAGPRGAQPITVGKADVANVLVHLDVKASIAGKVIDTSGNAVAGANVRAEALEEQKMSMFSGERQSRVRTAADGTFKIVGLDAGTYKVIPSQGEEEWVTEMIERADKDNKDKKDKKKPLEVELAAGAEKTGVMLTVEAHDGVIRGQVIGSDRKPAADAWVTARIVVATPKGMGPEDMDVTWFPTSEPVLTDGNGKFTIAKLKHGTYTVIADGPRGSSRAEKTGVKTGDSITIELQPLGALSGHVTLRGAPVTSYSIECKGPAGEVDRPVSAVDGAYSLEHLAPGAYSCSVDSDNGTALGKIDVPAGSATLELALKPWASLTGVVVSMFNGAPVPNMNAVSSGRDESSMMGIMTGTAPKTDAAGRFELDKIGAGSGTLLIMDPGAGGFKPLATKPYTATEGQRIDLGTIKIVPPRQGDAGTLGMTTMPGGESELVVTYVKPGGPADQAGVKVDDKVKTIGGQTIAQMNVTNAWTYLSSGSIGVGVTVQLGLDRGGQQLDVTITSVKWD